MTSPFPKPPTEQEIAEETRRIEAQKTTAFQDWLDRPEVQFILNTCMPDDETRRRAIVLASAAFTTAYGAGFSSGNANVIAKLGKAFAERFGSDE